MGDLRSRDSFQVPHQQRSAAGPQSAAPLRRICRLGAKLFELVKNRKAPSVQRFLVLPLVLVAFSLGVREAGSAPPALKEPTATPAADLKLAKGFQAELLYTVPKETQGSWVNMCVDPRGRLIVSDQYGPLYRVTPPSLAATGGKSEQIVVEQIPVELGEAHGLLWVFDSLYVVVNRGQKYTSGLYRVRDTDGDDRLDKVELLSKINGGGEHGPHAVVLAPDGKSLYVVCGNGTPMHELAASRVPRVWDEDLLLPRIYGRGFMRDTPAPGGYVCQVDLDGKNWKLVASGFRNQFDAAFNAAGELFTFDADMEWDINTPWYRPTRVCQVVSGGEFGWRNGSGKWPPYYADSVPPAVEIGPGSPTGICFGYGSRFPVEYQQSLFISDWTFGKLYAVHLTEDGASYSGKFEDFVSGTPLPLTDVVINPTDGAMYFLIGGRRVQSGLYRVTHPATTAAVAADPAPESELRTLRHTLEDLHLGDHADAVAVAWPYFSHPDRFIRYAARIAVEHRPVAEWQDRALAETDPGAALTALLALARMHERPDKSAVLDTPAPQYSAQDRPRHPLQPKVLEALDRIDWRPLSREQQMELLRAYTLALVRLGPPDSSQRTALSEKFDRLTPTQDPRLDAELAQLLVYLQAPTAAAKVVKLLAEAPTQEEQIDFAKSLRLLREGWTPELRTTYFSWFGKAAGYRGGASFTLYVDDIRRDAVANLTDLQRAELKPLIEARPTTAPIVAEPRPLVKKWTMAELVPLVETGLKKRDFVRGRRMFAAANCFACHRFDNQGGAIGPDLTVLSGRFGPRDVLESIVEPSKQISDQYAAVTVVTDDGDVVTGRIVNLKGEKLMINTNMLDPTASVGVDRRHIEQMEPSKVSMMPEGLLNTLQQDEILDLMAYLLSRGDPHNPMFGSR
jgi:putative heme-binding domain-containing protein